MQPWQDENAPIIESGDGFHLIDTDGRRYIDGVSSLWCNVHGHRVPQIDEAVREQLDKISHSTLLGLASPPSIELARLLVERAPEGLSRVFYSDSGSTTVEVAVKLAYQYHAQKQPVEKRDLFVGVGQAYHGDTIGSVSVGGIDLFHRAYRSMLFPAMSVPSPGGCRFPDGYTEATWHEHCFTEVERIVSENHQRIAAFVIEPLVQGAAGILVHPEGYLRHVRDVTRRFNIPLIVDEVAVGFGRTGRMFACEHEGVTPDFLCLAKGLSGGYLPVAATLTTEEIYQEFLGSHDDGRTFFHGHTFTGNPLGCAAAVASVKLFDTNGVVGNAQRLESQIAAKLQPLTDHPNVAEVRQRGIMIGIELVADRQAMTSYESRLRIGHQVTLAARKRGVIIRPLGDVVVLMPAPAMPVELVESLCDIVIESINDVVQNVKTELADAGEA
ncbi:UNVERIFIED_CONTAM: hypothetical protein GTU68_061253 [Idotea baltica]|nr:hypothetical protein [Idotea baltica]